MIKTKRGLDLPIAGSPVQTIEDAPEAQSVAIVGADYVGLKPSMAVAEGDRVSKGQLLFTDKKNYTVKFTAPASGTVKHINRGKKRVFQSLVIEVEGEVEGDAEVTFDVSDVAELSREQVIDRLIESGEWTSIRSRPSSKIPVPTTVPINIFVTAIDSRPLAANPELFINANKDEFIAGLDVMAKLTDGRVYVCTAGGSDIPVAVNPQVVNEQFAGPHPAGLVGTHIHFLSPVSQQKTVWHIGYQNIIAIGHLFLTGKIFTERVVSLAGPGITSPRLVRTRVGASLMDITAKEKIAEGQRIISGSVLDGRTAAGACAFLGRYHDQIAVLQEGTDREFMGFVMPGASRFSLTRLFTSTFIGSKKLAMTTNTGGSARAMVPLGTYEEVMPLDILATQLLRALLVGDVESSIQLGCLELDEEDLALCTFACPGKYEYGPYLREMLTRIEAEG